ncbi:hypothetical protein ILUMI_06266 [Ignelater luminosus]|uniref:Kinesin-associated protein 3 n=1 Tax=Ignelater luminosus TaxID=2038154 RepID=A0A8K0DAC2_IGNLU|nr:hypothetical protein ILUMI_06266 [Ignelater luminosus]
MLVTIVNLLSVLFSLILIVAYFIYIVYRLFYSMDPEDAKFMRTDRKPGTLDVHPTLNAIVLNYELEVQILGDNENVLYGEKRNMKKIIDLPMLNTRTDCNALAKEVLAQCDLIHPSRLVEVEQTIYYLKKRKRPQSSTEDIENSGKNTPTSGEVANINCLNEYIELLYEELPDKIKSSHLILQLARAPENLESLSKNETVLSALARVLREDWKRSIVLSTNLIFTFFCFSSHTCFHPVVLHYKIGSLCMDIIDFEMRRYEEWKADMEGTKTPTEPFIIKKSCPTSTSMTEIHKSRIPEPVRPKSGNFNDINLKTSMEGSIYDDLTNSTDSIDEKKQLTEEEKAKRYRTLIRKQEQLLRVAFYLLLNMAEDQTVEEKMTKRNIVVYLVKALDRDNVDLLALAVTFLKKLSLMQSNKDDMAEINIVDKLPRLLQFNNADLVHLTLKLLFNLSFDEDLRLKMVNNGLLPKFVSLLRDDRHQDIVIKLLYHLSYDEDVIAQFAYTDCVSLITDMLLLSAADQVDQVMVALCINLAIHPSNAQQMADNSRLQSLMTRAFRYQDALLMKMIHNISEHDSTRASFIEFVGDLAKAVTESKNENFVLECLGVLSNLHLPDLDWCEIFKHFNMLAKLKGVITGNNVEPDLQLQVIVLLGTAAYDEGCATLLCDSDVIVSCIDLLKAYQEDDEMVLQIIYLFFVLLSHDVSADYVINNTDAPAYLIDLLLDNNKAVRKICNTCLNIITERNPEWGERICIERFRTHNSQWLEMVDSHQLQPDEDEEDDNVLPPYLNTEYLSTAIVPPLSETLPIQTMDTKKNKDFEHDFYEMAEDSILQDYEMESLDLSL